MTDLHHSHAREVDRVDHDLAERHVSDILELRSHSYAARCNLEAHSTAMEALAAAIHQSGRDLESIAADLGAEPEVLEAMLAGDEDINLNELRMISTTLNYVMSIHYVPASVHWRERPSEHWLARTSRRFWRERVNDRQGVRSAIMRSVDADAHSV